MRPTHALPIVLSILSAAFAGNTSVASANADLSIGTRTVDTGRGVITEPTYRDSQGREIYLRGWNVSGSVKLASHGFKPFLSTEDAAKSFELMKRHTGANHVRFTLSWEGTHTGPDSIDRAYVDALIAQMKEAFRQKIYIFLDYHVDLFSRHVFTAKSRFTGNGAPEWVVRGRPYPKSTCLPVCIAWSQHNVTDPAVRSGYRNFFDNVELTTTAGTRRMQDEFLWQLREVLIQVKAGLTEEEFAWVTGVQPINEPIYGKGHKNFASEFDNEKLWPFYRKVRNIMDQTGWSKKWVYAEPMVFWDTNVGFFTPATGGHYLKQKPGAGYVFAPHFYDAARMGVTNAAKAINGDYFHNLDAVRSESRFLGIPTVLGEYGMWLKDQNGGVRDHARIVKATYQAMELSDSSQSRPSRRPDFYTSMVSGTQWHWDIYKDNHRELQNGNPNKLKTTGDAWNGEDFSVVKGDTLTVNADVVQRAFPRAVAGNIVSFHYNDLAVDGAGQTLDWSEIRSGGASWFSDRKFALLIWQGTASGPTELFLPAPFQPDNMILITENSVHTPSTGFGNMTLTREFADGLSGHRLEIPAANSGDTHFALVVNGSGESVATLDALRQSMIDQLKRQEHPVYLRGRMSGLNYPPENGEEEFVTLSAKETHFAVTRWLTLEWKSSTAVEIWKNDRVVMSGKSQGKAILLSIVGAKDNFRVCEKGASARCSRTLSFD